MQYFIYQLQLSSDSSQESRKSRVEQAVCAERRLSQSKINEAHCQPSAEAKAEAEAAWR